MNKSEVFSNDDVKALSRDLLNSNSAVKLKLGGYSMWPNLLPEDIAIIEQVEPSSLKLGQVLVVEIENRWIAHRLVGKRTLDGNISLKTQGDSIIKADGPLSSVELIGVVNQVERNEEPIVLSQVVSQVYVLLCPLPQLASRTVLKVRKSLMRFF